MKQLLRSVITASIVLLASVTVSVAQLKWAIGGNMGMAISTSPSSVDFTFGPNAELLFGKGMAVGSEFNIFTAAGTPIEWANYFKYYFSIPGSKVKPYANGGIGLVFVTGGPYFDIRFGGGASFEIARSLYISPDLQLGPVFVTGGANFLILIRGGIRYEL